MKTAWIKIVGIAAVATLLTLFARFLLGGDEDTWRCVNGSWVRHGNPTAPKPPDRTCGWPSVDLD